MSGRPDQLHEYLHHLTCIHFHGPAWWEVKGFSAQPSLGSLTSNRRAGERCDLKRSEILPISAIGCRGRVHKSVEGARSADKNVARAEVS